MILGIDPSLTQTACVWGDSENFESSTFRSKPLGNSPEKRILRLADLCSRLIAEVPSPSLVVFEGYGYDSKSGNTQAELGGILRLELLNLGMPQMVEVAPMSLKKFCTINPIDRKSKNSKQQVMEDLRSMYGVDFHTHDEFDAFGLFQLGLVLSNQTEPRSKRQQEVVNSILSKGGVYHR